PRPAHRSVPQSELFRSGTAKRVSVVTGGLEDYSALERAIVEHEVDTVFHLGAQTIVGTALRSPIPTFEANIRGTYNLLDACRVHQKQVRRVVVASYDKAYGDSDVLPYTEEMPPLGRHPYDVSKSCTDLLAHTYHHTYDLPVTIARCGNIYGGGDLNWSRIIPGTIRSLRSGQRPVLRSDGTFKRDYVYVLDAVSAYLAMGEALDRPEVAGEAYNFGPETPQSVLDIVTALQRLMQREDLDPVILGTAKAEIKDQYLDSRKAEAQLNWRPKYTLEAGLRETLDWYTDYLGS
ncbi:MAG: GDP-mannose 4,6-dehydratase, partial [Fibrella sp.]|nr:GDP-mannose 4,6-dehydratase [Armatimonadota bacterium]